jgi:hypothetical protein
MRRIGLAVVLALSLALAPLGVEGQQGTGLRHRVGLLNGAAPGMVEAVIRESLRALGYIEGTNLVIDATGVVLDELEATVRVVFLPQTVKHLRFNLVMLCARLAPPSS